MKQERNKCMEELHCNIVVMESSQPKVLRLNLGRSNELQTPFFSPSSSPSLDVVQGHKMKHSTPVSSPEERTTSYTRSLGENSISSSDTSNSFFLVYEQNPLFEGLDRGKNTPIYKQTDLEDVGCIEERIINLSMTQKLYTTSNHKKVLWIPQNHIGDGKNPPRNYRNTIETRSSTTGTEPDNLNKLNKTSDRAHVFSYSIREAVALQRTSSVPPPLCSMCQHKAPAFGKPPRRFDYEELEEATDGFSDMNFLAEGGFGLVHRGVLKDGLVVAVKQLKFAGSQGDSDFCREVRVLSCAQQRNVVLLVGYCIEGKKRVLVYEYICNGSLQFHLYGIFGFHYLRYFLLCH